MDSIIARLRNEPALVWGLIGTVASLIVTLAAGGPLTVAVIPVIVAAIARQFTVGPDTSADRENDAYIQGVNYGADMPRLTTPAPEYPAFPSAVPAFDDGYAAGVDYASFTAGEEAARANAAVDPLANDPVIAAFWQGVSDAKIGNVHDRHASPEVRNAYDAGRRSQDPAATN